MGLTATVGAMARHGRMKGGYEPSYSKTGGGGETQTERNTAILKVNRKMRKLKMERNYNPPENFSSAKKGRKMQTFFCEIWK